MPKEDLDLTLIYEERTGDFLFLLGTILAFISNFKAEQSLLTEKLLTVKPEEEKSTMSIALASWLFLLASILFTHVAIIRFIELKSQQSPTKSKNFPILIKGSKLLIIGDITKTAGFGIAAIAYLLKLIYYKGY
ncbi:hypothetical protein Desor_1354 [Desulfosporosinus orientis DSM 765]|uniref:Uncharacterized protein n=1 Tax=Desulfosporosinus orientis (strain ATCC 19365 / DSM 765 / NCIMB 8382 / VKM B-1628 / Singapore I) TaxID=768706 RepID=G7W5S8_DESOD|nr:hypothetical protein [Desulfosporosinus orientis]AET67016.1 hypothetical protein Desor_1354 [Desulfosporosinus orientis DSM 765]